MRHENEVRQRVVNEIADIYDLEPKDFEVVWVGNDDARPVAIRGNNIMALAYGRVEIELDEQDKERINEIYRHEQG